MTIMLAGGLTFAIPGVIPDVSAQSKETANLYVSTTTFGGPMIVEVIVRDSNLSDTDEPEAEPDVTFDGNDLRMVQATDGYWYAYVANNASIGVIDDVTDGTTALDGIGLDFGTYCPQDRTDGLFNDVGSEASGDVYVSGEGTCTTAPDDSGLNVLRSAKTLNTAQDIGNTDLILENHWPFIQTFSFADDADVDVVYSGGGASQNINLTYDADMDDFADYSLDRTSYPHGADVHLTISDNQLNIDPTDEDVWTFDTNGGNEAYYYVFNGNGEQGNGITNPTNYADALDAASFGDNGFLFIDPNPNDAEEPVLTFMDNADQNQPDTPTLIIDTTAIVTVQETSPNSGVFSSTDDAHNSILRTTTEEDLRDLDFIIDYNDSTTNYLVEYFVGMVSIDLSSIGSDWGSGESLSVSITDQDENSNTLVDDDFSVDGSTSIPTIQIGNPFTLEGTTVSEGTVELGVPTDLTADITRLANIVDGYDMDRGVAYAIEARDTAQTAIDAAELVIEDSLDATNITDANDAIAANTIVVTNSQKLIDDARDYTVDEQRNVDELQQKERERDELSLVSDFSQILSIDGNLLEVAARVNPLFNIPTEYDLSVLEDFKGDDDGVFQYINYDVRSLGDGVTITIDSDVANSPEIVIPNADQGLVLIANNTADADLSNDGVYSGTMEIVIATAITLAADREYNIVLDIFTFGQEVLTDADGNRSFGDKHNDAIYRFEAEETGTNTGVYGGTLEYIMLNQINIFQDDTYSGLATISDELDIIVHEDLTDEDAVELIYLDFDAQGVETQTSAQIDAPTYSGVVSFDGDNYKVADTVTITLEDRDLNTDSDVIDIYTVLDDVTFTNTDTIALGNNPLSLVLDVTFDDEPWMGSCSSDEGDAVNGLGSVISGLRETGTDTGIFTTNFQIPELYCTNIGTEDVEAVSVTGLDMEVNYQDFRDASGEIIEVGDSAGIRATTGSVALDRTVYPVPFGHPNQADDVEQSASQFLLHATSGGHLDAGILTVHVRVTDPDYDISGSGQDVIADNTSIDDEPIAHGPVKVMVTRGSETVVLGTAGGEDVNLGGDTRITLGSAIDVDITREYGPIEETAPNSGTFELDLAIAYTDGPASNSCPTSSDDAVDHIQGADNTHCILQGDILTVEYNDPTDASGDANTITDSATFDLRNGVLQTDKPVYIIGSDMILTLIEPDFDLDNDGAETYDLDLIEWDSDAATTTMGDRGDDAAAFDPEPSALRETGDSTGIFQIVIEIPAIIVDDNLERGEEIELEYTDWGPSGANYVGHEDEDVNVTVFTSNFGATIELDQNVYTWTDKVYITVVAPDHNFDGDLIDEIGNTPEDPLKVATRGSDLDQYKLVETGTDTGIFTGEVILTGFAHNADGDSTTGNAEGNDVTSDRPRGEGPTSGFLPTSDDDGLTVSFEFSENETVVSSALIRWNIGEAQWLEASYPASGTGIVRVIDPDMNLNPEAVNNFDVDVFSDSDAGGISLTVTETNEATGIFEGTVSFTIVDESSGHRLRVAEGDTVTAEYEDNTLPEPYTTADELNVTATTLIGTVVPPLERLPITNLRIVDAFGNSIDAVSIDQQVQLQADLINGQDRDQPFAYLIQVQNSDGVTVKLDWIKGATQPGQSFSAAVSWTPATTGAYTATAFGWESIDNPTALSPPVSVTINVS